MLGLGGARASCAHPVDPPLYRKRLNRNNPAVDYPICRCVSVPRDEFAIKTATGI